MPDNNVTLDYDGEPLVPPPASAILRKFLKGSFSVADLLKRALRAWFMALVGLVAGILVGLYSISTTTPRYSVTLGLMATESNGSDISEANGALGALGALVGINSGPVPKFSRFISSLYATGVAEIMDRKYDLICQTYSECDPKTHTWRSRTGLQARFEKTIAHLAHLPDPDRPQTAYNLAQYTKTSVQVSSDKVTRLVSLTAETSNPKFMSMYLKALVQSTNDYIKEQDRGVTQQYVDYLYRKIGTTTNLSQREALSSLVLEQERRLMLTAVDVPYAAYIQDGPNVSESNAPERTLIVDSMLGAILGALLGIVITFIPRTSAWRRPLWRRS